MLTWMFAIGTTVAQAQSLLPASVPALVEGVGGPVAVTLDRVVSTREAATTPFAASARPVLQRFGRQQTSSLPAGLQPEVAVYRMSGAASHWVYNDRTAAGVLAALEPTLETTPAGCTGFGAPLFRPQELYRFVLESRRSGALVSAAAGLADLLTALGTADSATWQPVYQRSCQLDDEGFMTLDHFVFLVDPTPFSDPSAESWVVVLRTGYSE
jgi:hypothetical protein